MTSFGLRLRELREGKGLSRAALAARCSTPGVGAGSIKFWETEFASRVPSLDQFFALCLALSLTDAEILELLRLAAARDSARRSRCEVAA